MSDQNIIKEALATSPNRRSLLKTLGVAGAALGATQTPVSAQGPSAVDVVQFALNLEYLEAEFYSVAVTGQTLQQRGIPVTGSGTLGATTTSFGKVAFGNNIVFTAGVAEDLMDDETAHVVILRNALQANGVTPIAKPAINLDALASGGASLQNQQTFLVLARAFEDLGVTAYNGGVTLLAGSPYLMTAARILAAEGQHAGNIRLQVARFGLFVPPMDAADVVPPPASDNFFATNKANGLTAFRTPGQVLHIAYGFKTNATSGGFYPNGVNGTIRTSSGPATAANLA
jgi:hypothetical protein